MRLNGIVKLAMEISQYFKFIERTDMLVRTSRILYVVLGALMGKSISKMKCAEKESNFKCLFCLPYIWSILIYFHFNLILIQKSTQQSDSIEKGKTPNFLITQLKVSFLKFGCINSRPNGLGRSVGTWILIFGVKIRNCRFHCLLNTS